MIHFTSCIKLTFKVYLHNTAKVTVDVLQLYNIYKDGRKGDAARRKIGVLGVQMSVSELT